MTIEDVENRLKSKLKRIENCETQFHIGQKQQIADVLAMLSLLDQPTVSGSKTILHRCSCTDGNLVEVKICLNCNGIL